VSVEKQIPQHYDFLYGALVKLRNLEDWYWHLSRPEAEAFRQWVLRREVELKTGEPHE